MRVTHFNKFLLVDVVRPAIREALDAVGKELGIEFELGTSRFSNEVMNCKIKAKVLGEDGEVFDEDRANFKVFCEEHGLKQEHLGKKFVYKGKVFTITGFRPRANKYKVRATAADGKHWRFPVDYVLRNLVEVDTRSSESSIIKDGKYNW